MGNGAKVLDDLVPAHAEAGIPDGEHALLLVRTDADAQLRGGVQYLVLGEHLVVDAVEGVGSVREQFAQEHLPLFIQGMDEDIQQLPGFGLERIGFGLVLIWVGDWVWFGHGGLRENGSWRMGRSVILPRLALSKSKKIVREM